MSNRVIFSCANNLPHNAFATSLQQNGKPLYQNPGYNVSRLEKQGYLKYTGWYAKEIHTDSDG